MSIGFAATTPVRFAIRSHLPKVEPLVDEYRLHALTCPRCGQQTRGELPDGVPTGSFGPTVVAVIALLLGVYGVKLRLPNACIEDIDYAAKRSTSPSSASSGRAHGSGATRT